MKIILSKNHSPFYNLVLEEIMLKDETNKEDIIFLYQHDHAIIIGKNQNTFEEIKRDVLEEKKIDLYRRISGGGAVYQDLGNICFSFITKKEERSYEKFLDPIIEFFKSLGLDAKFKGRNDLEVNGAKVSGNAQFIHKDRMFHHGTILFNADLTKLSQFLIPSKLKIESKGIKSARQRVTNILDELPEKMSDEEFIDKFVNFLIKKYQAQLIEVSPKYLKQIPALAQQRKSEAWVYGLNPEFAIINEAKFDKGILRVKLNINKNHIQKIKFEGDFLSKKDVNADLVPLLIGQKYDSKAILTSLSKINLDEYFGGITIDEIFSLIFGV